MPELSLAALRGLLPQMAGANFGVAGPQEVADMPLTGLDRAARYAFPFQAQPRERDETVQYRTASPYVNITEGDIGRATDAAMGASSGGLGIRAYHSSPHDFDKFDLSKIGTGEGAQAYGHGLYFAESPAVSGQGGQYWKAFTEHPNFKNNDAETMATIALRNMGADRTKAIEYLRNGMWQENYPKQWDEAVKLLQGDKPVGPRTYEVNINADPAHMLDWDKPLSRQSDKTQKVLQSVMGPNWDQFRSAGASNAVKQGFIAPSAEGTSALLNEAGIPGIKYLDEGSRNARPVLKTDRAGNVISSEYAPPTSNYVVFNDKLIDIMRKYSLAGLAPLAGYGAMAGQDQQQ